MSYSFFTDTASQLAENASSELELGVYKVTEELSNENFDVLSDDLDYSETQNLPDEMMWQNDASNNGSEVLDRKVEDTDLNERNDTSSESFTTSSVSNASSEDNSTLMEEETKTSLVSEKTEISSMTTVAGVPTETNTEARTQSMSGTETTMAETVSDRVEEEDSTVDSLSLIPSTTILTEAVTTSSVKCENRTDNSSTINTLFGDKNISVEDALKSVEKGLSNQIRKILHHYQKAGEVKIPGPSILPDPLDMPDTRNSFSLASMTFTNMKVYGLSNFTVEHVNTDIDKMQVNKLYHFLKTEYSKYIWLCAVHNYKINAFL